MALQWYALRSKPQKEEIVWRQVGSRGFEVFYPRLYIKPVNPRARHIRPYFPGYLFIRADLVEVGISTFQWMAHTTGLVSFGGEPAIVPDNLINAIQNRMDELKAENYEINENFHNGDRIRIHYGPFKGYEAIFDARIPGSERVRVLLKLLGDRYVPVEMDVIQIQKI